MNVLIDDHDTVRILKELEWFGQQHGPRNARLETREERIGRFALFRISIRRFAGFGAVRNLTVGRIHHHGLRGGPPLLCGTTFKVPVCISCCLPDAAKVARFSLRPCRACKQDPNQCGSDHFFSPLTAGRCAASRSPSMQPYSSSSTSAGRRRSGTRSVNGRENTEGFSTVAW